MYFVKKIFSFFFDADQPVADVNLCISWCEYFSASWCGNDLKSHIDISLSCWNPLWAYVSAVCYYSCSEKIQNIFWWCRDDASHFFETEKIIGGCCLLYSHCCVNKNVQKYFCYEMIHSYFDENFKLWLQKRKQQKRLQRKQLRKKELKKQLRKNNLAKLFWITGHRKIGAPYFCSYHYSSLRRFSIYSSLYFSLRLSIA